MKMTPISELYRGFCSFAVFRDLCRAPLFDAFLRFAASCREEKKLDAYGEFVSHIYEAGGHLSRAVTELLYADENVYVKTVAAGKTPSSSLEETAKRELTLLSRFASLAPRDFAAELEEGEILPLFENDPCDLAALYRERMENIHQTGYGIYAQNAMFLVEEDGSLRPIASADRTAIDHFVGYEAERRRVMNNVEAFLDRRPAANTLLYGDAGTGKSSTVKAVVNHYFDRGLRLIEIRKNQLLLLPKVMDEISKNPLRFILFIDDLSFNGSDDQFSMLKATLEGSACARADNAVIFATSNRRHIVRETFSDREGDEVHRNDTLQENLSLSERFGLTVLFARPEKRLYLEIVRELAQRHGIQMEDTVLATRAEEFALRRGHRSARAAEQFIESLL